VPQSWIEFEVKDIETATTELKEAGYETLVDVQTEPHGQIVSRFLSPEKMLVSLTHTPWMRNDE
jgi:hypothetical protein